MEYLKFLFHIGVHIQMMFENILGLRKFSDNLVE